jgi:hypothetical protein
VRDANRQQFAYVYFENEPGRRSAAKLLSKDEAKRESPEAAQLLKRILGVSKYDPDPMAALEKVKRGR